MRIVVGLTMLVVGVAMLLSALLSTDVSDVATRATIASIAFATLLNTFPEKFKR